MSIRYIVSDMDGTLLSPEITLTAYTREVLGRAMTAGIGVILASGRMTGSVLPYAKELGVTLPVISCNGALIADAHTGEVLRADMITVNVAQELARMLEAEGHYFQGYDEEGFCCERMTDRSRRYTVETGLPGRAVGKLSAHITQDTPKLLVIGAPEEISELMPRMQARFGAQLTITSSHPTYIEVTWRTATKGNALRALCQRLGADPSECVAFGDNYNDVTMLEAAGVSVAMGNAQPEIKDIADHVCLTNGEDGVARFVAERLLKEQM